MASSFPLATVLRLALIYGHLLACVFALHAVLSTDWRLLRSRISAARLLHAHRRVVWLLAALWASGAAIVWIDTQGQLSAVADNPKLIAKLLCVGLLTANGVLLRHWCFPRLLSDRPLGRIEAATLMGCGAVSTTCWLMAGFYGIARPLSAWGLVPLLLLLATALAVAVPLALSLEGRVRQGRLVRQRRRLRGLSSEPAPLNDAAPVLRGAPVAGGN